MQQASSGQLSAQTQPNPVTDTICQLPPSAGYQSLDNQLYRVEILQGGDTTTDTITYLWSRDNGTVVTTISSTDPLNIGDKVIFVDDVGPDDDLGFARTQLVEVSDDHLELHGLPGQLTTIADINRATLSITLSDPLSIAIDVTQHAKLRRWDGTGSISIPTGSQETGWLALENNIQVKFTAGTYKTGDYWLIPARAIDGTIEWPTLPQVQGPPVAQSLPPLGIQHHYAPLALLHVVNLQSVRLTGQLVEVLPSTTSFAMLLSEGLAVSSKSLSGGFIPLVAYDLRTFFQSLTEERPALHVLGTNWQNDSVLSSDQALQLVEDGLVIYLDDVPDPVSLIDQISVIVSVSIELTSITSTSYNSLTFLEGVVDLVGSAIRWRYSINNTANRGAIQRLFEPRLATLAPPMACFRVQLKGNLIRQASDSPRPTHRVAPSPWRYLDGQSLSIPGGEITLPGGTTRMQMQLLFPSGTGNQASDFESWFWMELVF